MAADSLDQNPEAVFDYVIIGGGTAGLTVASRLSEDPSVKVLVIEAGANRRDDPMILTPGLVGALYGKDEYDWNFMSTPQPKIGGRRICQPRGRVLGGSSALNFMMLLHPTRAGIDAWEKMGNKGWSYDGLRPYFDKCATYHPPSDATRETCAISYAGTEAEGTGPVQVTLGEGFGVNNEYWMKAWDNLGLKTTGPMTGKGKGAFQNAATIDPVTKTRSYAVTAYYSPEVAARENLVVWTETVAKRIVFTDVEDGELVASGVVVQTKEGEEKTATARLEVILAAGALQSPQILELSGIGNKELLESHQIPVKIDNPAVGEGVQDHVVTAQSYEVNEGVVSADVLRDPQVLTALLGMYQQGGQGPMGQSVISVAYAPLMGAGGLLSADEKQKMFAAGPDPAPPRAKPQHEIIRDMVLNSDEPVGQYFLFPGQANCKDSVQSMAEYLMPAQPENYLSVLTVLNIPLSHGSCHITSPDVTVKPAWDPAFFSDPADLEMLSRLVLFNHTLVNAEPFKSLFKPGGARIPDVDADTLEGAKEAVRRSTVSLYHPSGSCAMLPRESGGVVNERLVVHGTKNLRVVDAAVFPLVPIGNIQSVVYAVAEKAADLIKEDRKKVTA